MPAASTAGGLPTSWYGESDTAAKCSMKVEDSELLMSSMSAQSQFLFMLEWSWSWNAAWCEHWSVMGTSVTTSELYTAVVSYPCVQPGSYSCTGFYSRFLHDGTSFLETNFFAAEVYVIQRQNVVYKHCEFTELSSYFKHWPNTKFSSAAYEYEPCFLRISLGGSGPWWPRFAV